MKSDSDNNTQIILCGDKSITIVEIKNFVND